MRKSPPVVKDVRYRIEMTVSCRDADCIPKVRNAGKIELLRNHAVQVMHNGILVLNGGYHGDWMSEIITRLKGHHEPQEEIVFYNILKFLPDDARMIELGAFWSYYSIWFLKGHPKRKALGIEPDPSHIKVGRINADLNGVSLEIQQGCLGSKDLSKIGFETESSGLVEMPMLTASKLCVEFAPSELHVLHMDIQGAELDVILDCEELLRSNKIRFLVVSTHAELISGSPLTHQHCLDSIANFGGMILEEHDVHESFSGDGLIVAYFGSDPIEWPDLGLSYNRYSSSLFRNPLYDLSEAREEIAALSIESRTEAD